MGSWPNQWDCRFQEVSRFLETHTFAKNILHVCLNAIKSEGLLEAFDILVTLYERYDRNCVPAQIPPYWRTNSRGASLTHSAYSDSSLISALFAWLSIQHWLFVGIDSLLLASDGIKLVIPNIVPICIYYWDLLYFVRRVNWAIFSY